MDAVVCDWGDMTARRFMRVCSLLFGSVAVALLLSVPASAAAAVTHDSLTPPDGSHVGTQTTPLAHVDAGSAITGMSMSIDGAPASFSWRADGYMYSWYDDVDERWVYEWIVTDPTAAQIWRNGSVMSSGVHTVTVTTNTESDGTDVFSWSFTVEPKPVISAVSPLGGSLISLLTPLITATVTDDDSALTASMTVDSVQVTPIYDEGTKTFLYIPPLPLADNVDHTVSITVTDPHGIQGTRSWMFHTLDAPLLTGLTPSNGTTVTTTRPAIGFTSADGDGGPLSVVLKIDGSTVASQTTDLGLWRWMPPAPLANDASHTVRAEVTDIDANTTVAEWSFGVTSTTSFTGMSPSPGTMLLPPGSVSLTADSDLNLTGAKVYVDGSEVWWPYVSFTQPGYEDSDTGDWIVTDPTVATVSALSPVLSHGIHTVTVTLSTDTGAAPSQTWFFYVDTLATITDLVPPDHGACTTLTPTISARIIDDDSSFTCAMTLDGAPVTPAWDAGTKTYSYKPAAPLADNTLHTASITVTDPDGFPSTRSWTFTPHVGPALSNPVPSHGTTVTTARPDIGLTLADQATGTLDLRFFLDGHEVFSAPVDQGEWRWNPASALTTGTHSARAVVTDRDGIGDELAWSFGVALPAVVGESDCMSCHEYSSHTAYADCVTCHSGAHYIGSYECIECHGLDHSSETFSGQQRYCTHHHRWESRRTCTDCHPGLVAMHTSSEVTAAHEYSALPSACADCHAVSVITEHSKYPAKRETKYDCGVCHSTQPGSIHSKVPAPDVACSSCHANADHLTIHATTLPPGKTRCYIAGCHVANLITEHAGHDVSCDGCHREGYPLSGPFVGPLTSLLGASKMAPARGDAPRGMRPQAIVFDPGDAVNSGNTACDACHAPNTHGNREDCETCHGPIPATTDGSEPTAAPFPNAYVPWSTSGANAAVPSPHQGYALTTTKCAVCHAVHKAPASGELLLRGTAAAACEYCHVYTALGNIVVYGGDVSVYYAPHDNFSHNRTSDSACRSCHSVHGAEALAGANADKILWDWAAKGTRSYSAEATATWPDPASVGDDQGQITAWCTGCHSYYVETYDTTIAISSFDHSSTYTFTTAPGQTHVMRPAGSYENTLVAPDVHGTQVAYAGSTTCRACHDAGGTDQGPGVHSDSFPHYVKDYFRFMTAATSTVGSAEENTSGPIDGVCLKCHRANDSTGVGITY